MTNLLWLLMRSIEERKLTVAGVFAARAALVGAQAAALGTLYWYAAQAQSDAVVSLGSVRNRVARERRPVAAGGRRRGLGRLLSRERFVPLPVAEDVIGIGEEDLARRLTEVIRIARRLPDPRAPTRAGLSSRAD